MPCALEITALNQKNTIKEDSKNANFLWSSLIVQTGIEFGEIPMIDKQDEQASKLGRKSELKICFCILAQHSRNYILYILT